VLVVVTRRLLAVVPGVALLVAACATTAPSASRATPQVSRAASREASPAGSHGQPSRASGSVTRAFAGDVNFAGRTARLLSDPATAFGPIAKPSSPSAWAISCGGSARTPVRSVYTWQGQVHERTEGRVSVHTRRERVADIVARAKREHPYEIPGVSARPIIDGNPDYLAWIAAQTNATISA
jgi:uncharacterized protein involved in tolerance to divalent cations